MLLCTIFILLSCKDDGIFTRNCSPAAEEDDSCVLENTWNLDFE